MLSFSLRIAHPNMVLGPQIVVSTSVVIYLIALCTTIAIMKRMMGRNLRKPLNLLAFSQLGARIGEKPPHTNVF